MTIDDIALTFVERLSPRTIKHLIECFGSAEAIFAATEEELVEQAELRPEPARAIVSRAAHSRAEEELRFLQKSGLKAVAATDDDYPALLAECPDNPHVIYVSGEVAALKRPLLSMVGTREVTSYGLSMCDKLVSRMAELVPDMAIVSGLAYGVDVACHRAALQFGLPTIAVLANPLTHIYPAFHTDIAREMLRKGGAIVSENPSGGAVTKNSFLARNRIVAGLSKGTVVVESPPHGGSLSTAEHVTDYDRSLMAAPGRATDWASSGCNYLIKSMRAQMVCTGDDIVMELGFKGVDFSRRRAAPEDTTPTSDAQREIVRLLKEHDRLGSEEIVARSGLDFQEVYTALFELECAGAIRISGGKYERCK
ncbi:MAG: DNA-processing protein DprA [Rikenellaceae bacterium]|jgi:DNA processing protein|nr:DNA-processing protein DprA [Rikenellaceae bacterium]